MFCPKCGSQNHEQSKFCRGCGADLAEVAAMIAGKVPVRAVAERHLELQSKGVRGLVLGLGLMIVAVVGLLISLRSLPVSLFALIFAFVFLSSAVARFFQARGLRALDRVDKMAALPSSQTEFIKPIGSIYETDDLTPVSVTEHTTKHLSGKR